MAENRYSKEDHNKPANNRENEKATAKDKRNEETLTAKGGIKMGTTFAPEEIVKARELRSISQKKLRSTLHNVEKLGIDFSDGVSGVMIEYEKYKALVDRIKLLEEELDNLYLNELFKNRQTDIPDEEWVERPSGQSMDEFLRKKR